jgi:Alpha/beta hydrolase family
MGTFVLVHGAWHDAWCWRRVARILTHADHEVFTPALTGVGERSHLLKPDVNLDTHILDVANEIKWQELNNVVLVGHSYAGMVITGGRRVRYETARSFDEVLTALRTAVGNVTHGELSESIRDCGSMPSAWHSISASPALFTLARPPGPPEDRPRPPLNEIAVRFTSLATQKPIDRFKVNVVPSDPLGSSMSAKGEINFYSES